MCASLPAVPLLLAIHIAAHSVTFTFRARPATVRAAYTSKPLAECGSGRRVPLRGVHFVIHFMPAQSKILVRRLPGAGVVREAAKVCDFESDLGWAIGLDRRRPYDLARQGKRVTVTFR
jgi:hypothetical protein